MSEATNEAMPVINDAQSSIELTKGVKGEYGWHIKIYTRNDDVEDVPARLEKINAEMRERFS